MGNRYRRNLYVGSSLEGKVGFSGYMKEHFHFFYELGNYLNIAVLYFVSHTYNL